ncbi:hypothetical protein ANN_27812 [Periplaneta americana]|uniref:Putative nuclease HARBI1 n=1 Tax=Periplaneta americana TaxID=6978 RepID=A0ABQ8RVE2_PERAM|nr:hypothetical protein ANN_27812 [Periplaneta americana]
MAVILHDSSDDEDVNERRQRTFKDRINMDFVTYFEYNQRFRMSSIKMQALLDEISHFLYKPTLRNRALSPKEQLCIALNWFGNGGQYHAVGDMHGVSSASVCRVVHHVTEAINEVMFPKVVDWPEDVYSVVTKFYNFAMMPYVIGCVDGTLINIDAPSEHEVAYVDRHGKHSINCMVVCGPDLMFYYVSANWPGSVHDARILRNSSLSHRMEGGWRSIPNAIILGDSADPLKDWLIPPVFHNLNDPAVVSFNRSHKSTRRVVECAWSVLKEKFPCINYLRVKPQFAANIFKCCTTICIISRSTKEEEIAILPDNDEANNGVAAKKDEPLEINPLPPEGAQLRMQMLLNLFR